MRDDLLDELADVIITGAGRQWLAGGLVVGTGVFLRSPALRRWPAAAAKAPSGIPAAGPGESGAGRAIAVLAFATGAMGLCLGGLGLVIVAFAQAGHDPVAVAWRRQRHGGPGTPRLSCCR